jgi:hypothetical protein
MRIRPVALVLGGVACAAPAAPPSAVPAAVPARDAGPAPDVGAAPDAGREPDDDPPIDPRYRFAWQALRDDYDAFLATPITERCDIRRAGWRSTVICPGPLEMAGRVIRHGSGRTRETGIVIDRGRKDAITLDWKVALLDDDGHPVTGWFPVDELRDEHRAHADLDIAPDRAARYPRVGMRLDPQVQQQRFAPLHP